MIKKNSLISFFKNKLQKFVEKNSKRDNRFLAQLSKGHMAKYVCAKIVSCSITGSKKILVFQCTVDLKFSQTRPGLFLAEISYFKIVLCSNLTSFYAVHRGETAIGECV